MNDRYLKGAGVIMILIATGGIILSVMLVFGAFQTDKIWKAALMLFGALELLITAAFAAGVGKIFIRGLPPIPENDEEYDDVE